MPVGPLFLENYQRRSQIICLRDISCIMVPLEIAQGSVNARDVVVPYLRQCSLHTRMYGLFIVPVLYAKGRRNREKTRKTCLIVFRVLTCIRGGVT